MLRVNHRGNLNLLMLTRALGVGAACWLLATLPFERALDPERVVFPVGVGDQQYVLSTSDDSDIAADALLFCKVRPPSPTAAHRSL